ncbi:Retrotransposon-derived protein peg10, partial [Tulasnella sp. UAMH 9824]
MASLEEETPRDSYYLARTTSGPDLQTSQATQPASNSPSATSQGAAQSWGDILLRDLLGAAVRDDTDDWDEFKKSFVSAFGDPDKEGTAICKLESLNQGNWPAADFRCISADIAWNDQALRHAYRQGLSAGVKDGLIYHDKPSTLEELIKLSIRIDDRIWERKQERGGDNNPRSQPRLQPRPQPSPTPAPPSNAPNAFSHSQPVPIHVDAARRGRLTPEEHSRRQREGLCFYCGEKGHTAAAHQRPRQAVIDYQVPQSYAPTIAATQSPIP